MKKVCMRKFEKLTKANISMGSYITISIQNDTLAVLTGSGAFFLFGAREGVQIKRARSTWPRGARNDRTGPRIVAVPRPRALPLPAACPRRRAITAAVPRPPQRRPPAAVRAER